jgi:hypothetical protein
MGRGSLPERGPGPNGWRAATPYDRFGAGIAHDMLVFGHSSLAEAPIERAVRELKSTSGEVR